uniref:Phosphoglucomutase n=1 Tax=uncultured Candidatus Melainabacteria bacterium TaxID=2682970 RepID=A0A650EJ59_9BACT|nr:phosphoglucomutase [uncultured Candidatus Melainabacteria bacterium]
MNKIKFGTDGWRAVVGKDFNAENVAIVSKAIGKYVFDNYGVYKTIIVGYDPRNMAREFSMQCAETLKNIGFKVLYSDKVIPTPVLAYNAKILDACAVMFTASHNPPEYLGIKFIPDYAGPATSEITDEIVANLGKETPVCVKGNLIITDFSAQYFKRIKEIIDFNKIKNLKKRIIFDGLYAASIGYFDKLLSDNGIEYDSIHMYHDVNFGGGMPEPKPKFMSEMIEYVKNHKCYVGFANDGDSDRFGVVNENGEYVTPNEVIAILLMHLIKHKNYTGSLVKTVGGSLMLDIIAQKLGVEVIETPVGFKHVGEAMRKFNPVIAGEESGGLSIQGHIPEKDGILANLLILEAMAYEGKSLVQLQKELHNFVGCTFINTRVDKKLDSIDEIKPVIEKFGALENVAGQKITKKDYKDGVKLYLEDGKSWILVRPSGTEPLLRIYIESDFQDKIDKIISFVK